MLSGVFRGPGHFAAAAHNDPGINAADEVAAYAAEMRFALDFYGAHCRPILDHF
ncbi:hypothetical protein Ga0080574_TMP732 [Salipiger abyssi]|uniref:Uncharacterized protein n=1 Tax=Salipiger abyssi TaxID=1250539 RepID=A0A1P8UNU0_9RHOB|nr:hypothetical protein Ga0080574_TMP732 [Salipiger abyssi]